MNLPAWLWNLPKPMAAGYFREWDAHIGVMDILPPLTPTGGGGTLQKPYVCDVVSSGNVSSKSTHIGGDKVQR